MDYTCRNTIIQNMKDFGCDDETISEFLKCFDNCDKTGQKKILNEYRRKLMDELHKTQKKIDLLDFMVYQLDRCYCDNK